MSKLNLLKEKFYAVGEIGIDLFWDKTFLKEQQHAFQHQIQLAKKNKLGINIHCRDAFDETFEVLESEKSDDLFGIFHCFTGDFAQARKSNIFRIETRNWRRVNFQKRKNRSISERNRFETHCFRNRFAVS